MGWLLLLILGGSIVLSGVVSGLALAFHKATGVSFPRLFGNPQQKHALGLIPALLLKTGIFSVPTIWATFLMGFGRRAEITLLLSLLVGKSVGVLVYGYALLIFPIATRMIMPLIIRTRFTTIICNRCLRWTQALKSRYVHGIRYCELCGQPVEHTPNPGKVVLTFGDIRIPREGRIFLLVNPDFEHKDHRIDVSEVYLDTLTCDRRLLERFITYILNFPPRDGLASIQVLHRGALEELGVNLANTLRNNFTQIAELHAHANQ